MIKIMEGINNLGATCAINSLIQMICRNDKLRTIILNANVNEGTLTSELKEVLHLIHNEKKSLTPNKFINNFYLIFKGIFNRFEQIDINELWLYMIDKIHEETSYKLNIDNSDSKDIYQSTINTFNNNKTSGLLELVQGSFINVISCSNCNHKSHSFEPFITLAVDIQENKTIADLIFGTMTDENRERDEWKCENCNGNHNYMKMKRIWKFPEILVISLNRFKDIYNKDNSEVFVNEKLNFIIDDTNHYNYRLKSMGLHYGNLNGGHYMSICEINNETFNLYNDENVNTINKNDFLKSNTAYLIIYQLNRS